MQGTQSYSHKHVYCQIISAETTAFCSFLYTSTRRRVKILHKASYLSGWYICSELVFYKKTYLTEHLCLVAILGSFGPACVQYLVN